jgi:polynucleotide 5'-kinase involved in rRNA processing
VVGLANGTELQPILSGSRARSLRVGTAKAVLERSRSDRREIRTVNYRRFLEGGKIRTVSLRDVNISTPRGLPRVDEPRAWELSNLVVGLLNGDGYMIQIGILIDVGDQTARIYSRPAESVRRIEVGYVKLSTAGTELGYFED